MNSDNQHDNSDLDPDHSLLRKIIKFAAAGGLLACLLPSVLAPTSANDTSSSRKRGNRNDIVAPLSSAWGGNIQQWAIEINSVAQKYGLDADLIAAVVEAESHGSPQATSYVGAVGLMGIMPAAPGMEWRPSAEELGDPTINLEWGTAILADILWQAEGDISAALAAYNGGWEQAHQNIPTGYAADVLHRYARAVMIRSQFSPDFASRWTIGIEMRSGHITPQNLLLAEKPLADTLTYARHILFTDVNEQSRALHVVAYAVPLILINPVTDDVVSYGDSNTLHPALMAHLDEGNKELLSPTNRQVLLTCLPSISRLRQRVTTAWYAPSACPNWHR